jgi:hypothetical protein
MPRATTINRACSVLVAACLGLAPTAVLAGPRSLSPEKTDELRTAARNKAATSGGPEAEADILFKSGESLSDPILMLDSADKLRLKADQDRSTEVADVALEQVYTALDVVYFMMDTDQYKATKWHPVDKAEFAGVRDRAEILRDELKTLIEVIEEERRQAELAAMAPPPEENKKREIKPGTGLIVGGAASLVLLGGGGLALSGTGLALGSGIQKDVEALTLPQQIDEYNRLDAQGKQYNTLAIVGGVVATVGVGVGIGLVIAGVKKRKGSNSADQTEQAAHVTFIPTLRGAVVTGRF